jgi:hypothetical protein
MRHLLRWLLLLIALLVGVLALGVGRLVLADRSQPGTAEQRLAHETLHYWGHLLLGRSFSVTPGFRSHASVQYQKAAPHAHTLQQRAFLTSQRPHHVWQLPLDGARVSWGGLHALWTSPVVQPVLLWGLVGSGLAVLLAAVVWCPPAHPSRRS